MFILKSKRREVWGERQEIHLKDENEALLFCPPMRARVRARASQRRLGDLQGAGHSTSHGLARRAATDRPSRFEGFQPLG